MSSPLTAQQCFFVAIFAFIVAGFYRGWRRETISLIFILLAVILVHPGTSQVVMTFLQRVPAIFSYLITGKGSTVTPTSSGSNFGPFFSLLLFALIVALGYVVGNRAFPKPATPSERFLGIVPAVIAGAAILYYLNTSDFFSKNTQGQASLVTVFMIPDPAQYVPIIFIIAIVAVVVGLIASRAKKSAPPAAKK
jgi:hypothetical protein